MPEIRYIPIDKSLHLICEFSCNNIAEFIQVKQIGETYRANNYCCKKHKKILSSPRVDTSNKLSDYDKNKELEMWWAHFDESYAKAVETCDAELYFRAAMYAQRIRWTTLNK